MISNGVTLAANKLVNAFKVLDSLFGGKLNQVRAARLSHIACLAERAIDSRFLHHRPASR